MHTNKRRFSEVFLWAIVVFGFVGAACAQQPPAKITLPPTVENHKLSSKLMAREMPYRVVLPVKYKNQNEKTLYPVVYLLHGLTGHFDNWTEKTKLAEYAAKYDYIIVTPEGGNGWYSDSVTVPNDKYESYIIQELIPEIDKKFRTAGDRSHRAVAGLSMGGYGSIKFGLKYPEMFALVGSFSGAVGAASWTEKDLRPNSPIAKSLVEIFGIADSQTRLQNDLFKRIKESPADKINSLPFIYIDCGTEDFLFQNNRDFVNLLIEKKVKHEFRQLPGGHDWKFWDAQVQEFLELSERFIK